MRSFFAEGTKHVHHWAVTNMLQGDMWIFTCGSESESESLFD
jgi:hypothetical protein